jgi:hypothetical protein
MRLKNAVAVVVLAASLIMVPQVAQALPLLSYRAGAAHWHDGFVELPINITNRRYRPVRVTCKVWLEGYFWSNGPSGVTSGSWLYGVVGHGNEITFKIRARRRATRWVNAYWDTSGERPAYLFWRCRRGWDV